MAREGFILPMASLLMVDKTWNIYGRRTPEKEPRRRSDRRQKQVKIHILGENNTHSASGISSRFSLPHRSIQYHFVQSEQSRRAAAQISKTRVEEVCGNQHPAPLESSTSKPSQDVPSEVGLSFSSLPVAASVAFYGNVNRAEVLQNTEILKYYPSIVYDIFYPLRSVLGFDSNPMQVIWLPRALHDQALLSTILLSTAVRLTQLNRKAYDTMEQKLKYASIRIINQRMQARILSDDTIAAISCMTLVEAFHGRMEEYRAHQAGLIEAIRLRGGMRSIEPSLQTKIYRAAILPAVDFLEEPGLPRLRLSRHAVHPGTYNIPRKNSAFGQLLARFGLDPHVLEIFVEMHYLSHGVDDAVKTTHTINHVAFDAETLVIFHDLLAGLDTARGISTACRCAGLIYMNTLTRGQPFLAAYNTKISAALKSTMEALAPLVPATVLLFWISFMGALASTFTAERTWFRDVLGNQAHDLNMRDWTDCKEHLQNVLWIGKVHDRYGITLWNEIDKMA